MKTLVTGGAGFIGSHLCESLIEKGEEVICVDNFNDYYNPKFKEENIKKLLKNRQFSLHRIDFTDFALIKQVFDKHSPDKVVHLGARAGVRPSIENPGLYYKVNVQGTLNMLELSKDCRQFIFGSSSSVYGENKKVPFSEEDKTDNPISPYAATKKSAELMCHTYHKLHGTPITCLRFFTVYGPRGRPDMAPYIFTKSVFEGKPITRFGKGKTKRDYTYVSDIVAGINASLDKELDYEIINLGDSNPIDLNYFITLIEKSAGKKAQILERPEQQGDVSITFADISKARRLLKYNPKVKIEAGISLFVDWYKENRV
jgi:UDP-glucuronate 4-epimerase